MNRMAEVFLTISISFGYVAAVIFAPDEQHSPAYHAGSSILVLVTQ